MNILPIQKLIKPFVLTIFVALGLLIACSDDHENHALAIRNQSVDTIILERYSGGALPIEIQIPPMSVKNFYETSTDLWLTPPIELGKISDSLVIYYDSLTISFSVNQSNEYLDNPYGELSYWETVIEEYETSSIIGNKIGQTYIHTFTFDANRIIAD